MSRRAWWGLAAFLAFDMAAAVFLMEPAARKHTLRTIYVWLWTVAPKPEGTPIPDRFL